MGKGILKKRRQIIGTLLKGPCYASGCNQNGSFEHVCVTCEKLREAQGSDLYDKTIEIFRVQCCGVHWRAGQKKVKRHALTAHPANLLRVIAAGLKGEEI